MRLDLSSTQPTRPRTAMEANAPASCMDSDSLQASRGSYRGNHQKNCDPEANRLPERPEPRVRMDHDRRLRAGRWMHRPAQKHDDERERECDYVDPWRISEHLEAEDPDERPAEMTSEQGSRLGPPALG